MFDGAVGEARQGQGFCIVIVIRRHAGGGAFPRHYRLGAGDFFFEPFHAPGYLGEQGCDFDERPFGADGVGGRKKQVAERHILGVQDVTFAADVALQQQQHELRHVAHIHETGVADGPEFETVVQLFKNTSRADIPETTAQHHRGIDDRYGQAFGIAAPHLLFRLIFADRVLAVAFALYPLTVFVKVRAFFGAAEGSDTAHVYQFLHAKVQAEVYDIGRALHVDIHHTPHVARVKRHHSRAMAHMGHAGEGVFQADNVGDVGIHPFHLARYLLYQVHRAVRAAQGAHAVAVFNQQTDEIGADEAGTAGDEDFKVGFRHV